MSYMRQPFYAWQDGNNIHIEGVSMPLERFDELCAMRWAQLSEDERERAEERAIRYYTGEFGCDPLRKQRGLEPILTVAMREAEMRARQNN